MQQQIQRPISRKESARPVDDAQDLWPQSAREFMKLPVSGLLAAKRFSYGRLNAPAEGSR
ncbi:hypothetical protein [Nitrospira sp. Nam80]